MRRRAAAAGLGLAVAALGVVLALVLSRDDRPARTAPPRSSALLPAPPPRGSSLAIGLTEMNPALLWSAASGVDVGPFAPWRDRLAALRPRYLRVLVDWTTIQPDAATPPNLDLPDGGCARGLPPCRHNDGLREVLRAARSQQQSGGGFEVVLVIYGTPDWAAQAPSGCEHRGTEPRSRRLSAAGLLGYRALIRALVELGRQERVPLRWWSPWNEPNGRYFVSPQHVTCDRGSALASAAFYTTVFRTMRQELQAAGGDRRMLLGDLADGVPGRLHNTPAPQFLAALPADVVCGAGVMSQHAYTRRGPTAERPDPVRGVEAVLARRECSRGMPVWLTEVGAGGPVPSEPRTGGAAGARVDCRALHADLRRWWSDPNVTTAFQYTFRDDPAFPVGLADAKLEHAWPTLDLLAAWGGRRAPDTPPPPLPATCGA